MRYSITGWAPNGTPVSKLVEFPDEESVRAWADGLGITLSKIEVAPEHVGDAPVANIPRQPPTEGEYLGSVSGYLFTFAWLCLAVGLCSFPLVLASSNPFWGILNFLIPLALFLILIGVIYRVGGSIVRAIESK